MKIVSNLRKVSKYFEKVTGLVSVVVNFVRSDQFHFMAYSNELQEVYVKWNIARPPCLENHIKYKGEIKI